MRENNMNPKVLIVISSTDREKIWTGLLYAQAAIASDWMKSVKVILWGPSSKVVAKDTELQGSIKEIIHIGEKIYVCKACSDKYAVSDKLEELGCNIEYVGPISSRFIKEGYVVFNW
jgi:hypothetical protein